MTVIAVASFLSFVTVLTDVSISFTPDKLQRKDCIDGSETELVFEPFRFKKFYCGSVRFLCSGYSVCSGNIVVQGDSGLIISDFSANDIN